MIWVWYLYGDCIVKNILLSVHASENKKAVLSERKPRDAAAVLFGLKFADNIHYKFKSIVKLRKPGFRVPNIPAQNRI